MKSNKKRQVNNKVKVLGVIPESLNKGTVYKSAAKGQTSFRITAQLLNTLCQKSSSNSVMPRLILTIPDGKGALYTLNCTISLEKGE